MTLPAKIETPRQVLALAAQDAAVELSVFEQKILSAGSADRIGGMPSDMFVPEARRLFKFIGRDVGIQVSDEYDEIRFTDTLRDYFRNMTLNEVKLAFELLNMGELDAFLPNSKGVPDREHFQQFNMKYLTRVLQAFQQYRGAATKKVRALLPAHSEEISDKEKQLRRDRFVNDLKAEITGWYGRGTWSPWKYNSFVLDYLVQVGICKPITTEHSEEALTSALHQVLGRSHVNSHEKAFVRKKGPSHSLVQARAYLNAIRKAIEEGLGKYDHRYTPIQKIEQYEKTNNSGD